MEWLVVYTPRNNDMAVGCGVGTWKTLQYHAGGSLTFINDDHGANQPTTPRLYPDP